MVIHMKASRVREAYTDDFYVAYLRDPVGNKIAVFLRGDSCLDQAEEDDTWVTIARARRFTLSVGRVHQRGHMLR
jgi:hypothetical protein